MNKIQSSWFKSGSGAPAFLSRPYQEVLTRQARATIDDVWGVDAVVFNYTFYGMDLENNNNEDALLKKRTPDMRRGLALTLAVALCAAALFAVTSPHWRVSS